MVRTTRRTVMLMVQALGLAWAVSPGRLLAAPGDLDTSFAGSGKVATPVGTSTDVGRAVAVDGSGRIVVAGTTYNGANNDIVVLRYTTGGALDGTFGTLGKVITAIGSGNDTANAVAIDGSGRIVVAGATHNGTNNDVAVVRYTATGALDGTFGTAGKAITPINGDEGAQAVAIDGSGRIVVAGSTYNGSNVDVAVVRYTSSGTLDGAFGTAGKVVTPIGTGTDVAEAVAIDGSGRIVAAGWSQQGSNQEDVAVLRYTSSGALDGTFGTGGKVVTPIGTSADYAYDVAIDGSGRIVVTGAALIVRSPLVSDQDVAVVRYTAGGALDATFGTGGTVITTVIQGSSDYARAVGIDSAGRILVAGSKLQLNDPFSTFDDEDDFVVLRYASSGALDGTFGSGGMAITAIGPSNDNAEDLAIDGSGRIVVTGSADMGLVNGGHDVAVVRYLGGSGCE